MARFYRVVKTDPPAEADFLSHTALGLPLRHERPEARRSWERVSVYDVIEKAREPLIRFPRIGTVIAELLIEDGSRVRVELSGADLHHVDLDAKPDGLLALVGQVFSA